MLHLTVCVVCRFVLFIRDVVCTSLFFFFFSSRRRHTRCSRDWSSDVCSSDLLCLHGSKRCPRRPATFRSSDESSTAALGDIVIAALETPAYELANTARDRQRRQPKKMTFRQRELALDSFKMNLSTLPIETSDPLNARILAVSEDRVQGFQRDPLG